MCSLKVPRAFLFFGVCSLWKCLLNTERRHPIVQEPVRKDLSARYGWLLLLLPPVALIIRSAWNIAYGLPVLFIPWAIVKGTVLHKKLQSKECPFITVLECDRLTWDRGFRRGLNASLLPTDYGPWILREQYSLRGVCLGGPVAGQLEPVLDS